MSENEPRRLLPSSLFRGDRLLHDSLPALAAKIEQILSNGAVENNRKHDDLAMGPMGIRPHGQQRIASYMWHMHRICMKHSNHMPYAWNNVEKTGWI